jgi:hypothetical protein
MLATVPGKITTYVPYDRVSVMGCVEQYTICKDENHCTKLGGQEALGREILGLGLNAAQWVSAQRMIYMIAYANTYSSINGIGPDALRLWNEVYDLVAPMVPQNQWKIEVEGWFETTLAKWQAFMVEFAANTANLGESGYVGFPISNTTLDSSWRAQCRTQKISNLGNYQNVSIFGLSFTWAVGMFLVILSWLLNQCVSRQRQWTGRRSKPGPGARHVAWNIDGKFQQHRVALRSAGYYELRGGENDVPYLEKEAALPLPFQAIETNHDTRYESSAPSDTAAGSKGAPDVAAESSSRHTPEPARANEGNGRTEEGSRVAEENVEVNVVRAVSKTRGGGTPPLSKNQNSVP